MNENNDLVQVVRCKDCVWYMCEEGCPLAQVVCTMKTGNCLMSPIFVVMPKGRYRNDAE